MAEDEPPCLDGVRKAEPGLCGRAQVTDPVDLRKRLHVRPLSLGQLQSAV